MSKKSNFWFGLFYIITLVMMAVMCYNLYTVNQNITKENLEKIDLLDLKLRQSESIIDSLENTISLRESLIDSLSFSRQEVIIKKNIVIEEVKSLPLTEAVEFLSKNLKMYEERTKTDSMSNHSSIY